MIFKSMKGGCCFGMSMTSCSIFGTHQPATAFPMSLSHWHQNYLLLRHYGRRSPLSAVAPVIPAVVAVIFPRRPPYSPRAAYYMAVTFSQ
jgi:hypothetical protein